MKKIFAIDFDGTIVKHNFPEIGDLIPGAKRVINALVGNGHTVLIWTVRSRTNGAFKDMIEFLVRNQIKYHDININAPQILNDPAWKDFSPKIYADMYIDDRAFGCPVRLEEGDEYPCVNWDEIEKQFKKEGIL